MDRHGLDHASTSPLRPEGRAAMSALLQDDLADPSRIHRSGMETRALLEQARDSVAAAVGARPREVIFTSGATESIAAACWGTAPRGSNQVMAAVEHSAVREGAAAHGEVRASGVDRTGRIEPGDLLDLVDDGTAVVHVQWINHEVGTVQPVEEIVSACRERGVLVHVDAAQAVGRVPLDFVSLGADLLSFSGHKLGGPPGSGALLVRRGLRVRPLLAGGDQELARRAGMENVLGAAGLAAALTAIEVGPEARVQRRLTDRLRQSLGAVDGVEVYGSDDHRAPHIVCAGIADIEPQAVLLGLDRRGIDAHSGSACASGDLEPSPVLEAMGVDAHRSLRLSVGWSSTEADVDAFDSAFPGIVAELRNLRGSI